MNILAKNKEKTKSFTEEPEKIYKELNIPINRINRPQQESFENYAQSFIWPQMEIPQGNPKPFIFSSSNNTGL